MNPADGCGMSDSLTEAAAAPKSVTIDGVAIEQHDLKSQIELDRYLRRANEAVSPQARCGFVKIVAPSAR